jgi:hypothetical protein
MRTPVYVAGASAAWQRARDFAQRLQETGSVEIAGKWWHDVEANGAGNDRSYSLKQRRALAAADLDAVDQAAIVVVLWDEYRSEGRSVELGFALRRPDVTKVLAGPDTQRCIFLSLCDITFDGEVENVDERAFDAVMDLVNARVPVLRQPFLRSSGGRL